jgi:hypothetical protein
LSKILIGIIHILNHARVRLKNGVRMFETRLEFKPVDDAWQTGGDVIA